jgi:hypothetical protein
LGSIQWKKGQDFCPDTLYLESELMYHLAASHNDESDVEQVGVEAAAD